MCPSRAARRWSMCRRWRRAARVRGKLQGLQQRAGLVARRTSACAHAQPRRWLAAVPDEPRGRRAAAHHAERRDRHRAGGRPMASCSTSSATAAAARRSTGCRWLAAAPSASPSTAATTSARRSAPTAACCPTSPVKAGDFRLQVVELSGGSPRSLTNSRDDESPSFAPNGRLIIYATRDGGRDVLMTTTATGASRPASWPPRRCARTGVGPLRTVSRRPNTYPEKHNAIQSTHPEAPRHRSWRWAPGRLRLGRQARRRAGGEPHAPAQHAGRRRRRRGWAGQSGVAAVDLTGKTQAVTGQWRRIVYFDFDSYVVKEEFRPIVEATPRCCRPIGPRRS